MLGRAHLAVARGEAAALNAGRRDELAARLLAAFDAGTQMPPLVPGELVISGTLTDAWFVAPGETWSSDYGELGVTGLHLRST